MIRRILVLIIITAFSINAQDEGSYTKKSSSLSELSMAMSVTIGGNFIVTGTFPAAPGERVDQFVTRLFNQAKSEKLALVKDYEKQQEILEKLDETPTRDIKLRKNNGTEIAVDLAKFRLTGDFKYNPYLSHEDVLIFPSYDFQTDFVSVLGAVNIPVKFQYVAGDKFSDALMFAQGLNNSFENIKQFKIVRLSYDGNKEETLFFDINENPELKRGDRIVVLAETVNRKDFRLYIAGEVKQSGWIPITKGTTTLKDVIEKAGGLKENADLNRAELIRGANVFKSPVFNEEFEKLLMQRMADISPEDSISFMTDNKLRFARGNAVLDFSKLDDSNSVESKFVVKDGDYIFIPEKLNLVYVFGQVNSPGYIKYEKGEDVNYYLNLAGGIGKTAREEIYLIKGKTRGWTLIEEETKYVIEPGDYIWIPKELRRDFTYYSERILAISSVVGTLTTIALLIVQLTK